MKNDLNDLDNSLQQYLSSLYVDWSHPVLLLETKYIQSWVDVL